MHDTDLSKFDYSCNRPAAGAQLPIKIRASYDFVIELNDEKMQHDSNSM